MSFCTPECLENVTLLWVLSQVSKQGHPLLRHQHPTPDSTPLGDFLQEKHKNGRDRLGTSTQQKDTAVKSSTELTTNSCPWPRSPGKGRKQMEQGSSISFFSSVPSTLHCLRTRCSEGPFLILLLLPTPGDWVWFFLPSLPVSVSRSWRCCAKNTGLWKFPEQMLSRVWLSQNIRQCSQLRRTLSYNPLNKLSENK